MQTGGKPAQGAAGCAHQNPHAVLPSGTWGGRALWACAWSRLWKKTAGQPRLACQVKPAPEMQIRTSTERILRMRAISARLLLQHAPFPKQPAYHFLVDIVTMGGMGETQPVAPAGDASGCKQPVVFGGAMPDRQSQSDSDQITSNVSTAQTGCILCGLCVRACAKTGRGGLAFSGKGGELKIVAWAGHEDCGRCGSCIAICPTGFLNTETRNKILIEW